MVGPLSLAVGSLWTGFTSNVLQISPDMQHGTLQEYAEAQ